MIRGFPKLLLRSCAVENQAHMDRDLLERCRTGDEEAWEALLDRHGGLVLYLARHAGLGPTDAEEVLQETFLALVTHLDSIQEPRALKGWIATTARRAAVRLRTKRRSEGTDSLDERRDEPLVEEEVEDVLVRIENRQHLAEALELIGERCRRLLLMLYGPEKTSYEEISRTLDLAMGSIGPTRGRCMDKLRRAFRKG